MSNAPLLKVALSREALKYYTKVSINTAARLDRCFAFLESDPTRGPNIKQFKELDGKYRYRVGNLRVVYEVDIANKKVYVFAILPRGQAYNKS
jgi:mRNA interferase RelE/StbE